MKLFFFIVLLFIVPTSVFADVQAGSIVGKYWNDEKNSIIEIYSGLGDYRGRVYWRYEPYIDKHNPDPALRSRSIVGVTFLTGFTFNTKKKYWEGGRVYSPDNGKTYTGKMWLEGEGEVLKMRGFVGISLLGRTEIFTRMSE